MWSSLNRLDINNKNGSFFLDEDINNPDIVNDYFIDAIPATEADCDLVSHFLSGLCGKGIFQFRPADPELIEQIVLRQKPHL